MIHYYLAQVRGIKPRHAFIYGHSLGGAIAIELALHHPEAAGLITESTFTSKHLDLRGQTDPNRDLEAVGRPARREDPNPQPGFKSFCRDR